MDITQIELQELNSELNSLTSRNDDTFTMLFPPLNVTGNAHLGHALTVAMQDSIVRFHKQSRHKYSEFTYPPGMDHAGV